MWLEKSRELEQQIVDWRREFHRIPELGFDLEKTATHLEKILREMGLEPRRFAGTGVVADIEASDLSGPVIGLRADMDAMPVDEETGLPFSSEHPGAMHACGHDAHMAMLLGAAKLLLGNSDRWKGRVRLIFQPAEELVSGARKMIEEGVLENPRVEMVFGLHIWQVMEFGKIGLKPGIFMASADNFSIRIKGKAAHGAMPHEGRDSVAAAADLIHGLQANLTRVVPTTESYVLTFGKINGGTKGNIVAETVDIDGTFRTFSPEIREIIKNRFADYLASIEKGHGVKTEYRLLNSAPPLINDPDLVEKLEKEFGELFGPEKIVKFGPVLPSEDFAEFCRKVPSVFFFLGAGGEDYEFPHHHSRFDIDERALPFGTAALLRAVEANSQMEG